MKLIYAIVRDEDDTKVVVRLNREGFSVTRLATTGGFLRAGNTTLIIGTDEERVDHCINILKEECQSRKSIVTNSVPMMGMGGLTPLPVTVDVGGAVIFVMNVERYEKV